VWLCWQGRGRQPLQPWQMVGEAAGLRMKVTLLEEKLETTQQKLAAARQELWMGDQQHVLREAELEDKLRVERAVSSTVPLQIQVTCTPSTLPRLPCVRCMGSVQMHTAMWAPCGAHADAHLQWAMGTYSTAHMLLLRLGTWDWEARVEPTFQVTRYAAWEQYVRAHDLSRC
jgi:hypothetical protein